MFQDWTLLATHLFSFSLFSSVVNQHSWRYSFAPCRKDIELFRAGQGLRAGKDRCRLPALATGFQKNLHCF
jgi:hypothetical protein